MTTIIDGSAGVTFPNSTVQASAGSVLQTVQGITTATVTTTSTTAITTGLTASITPKFTTSKILALINFGQAGVNGSGDGIKFFIYKNGVLLSQLTQNTLYNNGTGVTLNLGSVSLQYLDSPATTSATTYAIYFSNGGGTLTVVTQRDSIPSYITLMEIAG